MNEPASLSLCLSVTTGPNQGACLRHGPGVFFVGRALSNALPLPDDFTVSDDHARFFFDAGHWYVEDCDSRNGVYVQQGQDFIPIVGAHRLQAGQPLHLGSSQLEVDFASDSAPAVGEPGIRHGLRIRLDSGRISYAFEGVDPVSRLYALEYPAAWVAGAVKRFEDRMRLANLGPEQAREGAVALADLGEQLACQLVPDRVREKLTQWSGGGLLITHDSELLPVPWEWIRLDGESWCERFDLGRQVVLEHTSVRLPAKNPAARVKLLIAVNPQEDLEEAQAAGEALLRCLAPSAGGLDVVFLSGRRVTVERLLGEMEQAGVVYYFGHGEHDPGAPARSGWQLADGPLSAAHVQRLKYPPGVIFSNACESAREGAGHKAGFGYSDSLGMASRFILAGVETYIGALWPIHACAGAEFGANFLERFLNGVPAGAALRQARLETRATLGDSDLAWASYILYGDPLKTIPGGAAPGRL